VCVCVCVSEGVEGSAVGCWAAIGRYDHERGADVPALLCACACACACACTTVCLCTYVAVWVGAGQAGRPGPSLSPMPSRDPPRAPESMVIPDACVVLAPGQPPSLPERFQVRVSVRGQERERERDRMCMR
jgi:hypothetical protein